MNKPPTIEAVVELCRFLLKRSDDAFVRAETMRQLLEAHGVFSAAEFEALHEKNRSEYREKTRKVALQAAEDAHSAALRQLLESFEGKPQ